MQRQKLIKTLLSGIWQLNRLTSLDISMTDQYPCSLICKSLVVHDCLQNTCINSQTSFYIKTTYTWYKTNETSVGSDCCCCSRNDVARADSGDRDAANIPRYRAALPAGNVLYLSWNDGDIMLLHRPPAGHEFPPGEVDNDVGMKAFICSRP